MEIGDRIKELRKHLQLTQAEFGEKIGLKPTAIGQMEGSTRNVTDRTVILISEKYNVDKDWLLSGSGEMFVKPSTFSLDEYARTQDLKETKINLIRGFMELDPNVRSALFNMFKNAFSNEPSNNTKSLYEESPKTPEELEMLYPPLSIQEKDSKVR